MLLKISATNVYCQNCKISKMIFHKYSKLFISNSSLVKPGTIQITLQNQLAVRYYWALVNTWQYLSTLPGVNINIS